MPAQIKYAYLKGETWMYRRTYPKAVATVLGASSLKRSLKTGDLRTARARAAEVNAVYEAQVQSVLTAAQSATETDLSVPVWEDHGKALLARLRSTLEPSEGTRFEGPIHKEVPTLGALIPAYLSKRQHELRPSGYKSVRYAVELIGSKYGDLEVTALGREQGREFLSLIAQLSPLLGKSSRTVGLTLDEAVEWSRTRKARIKPKTQRRIWTQTLGFLDWLVYEGHVDQNPFRTVRFEGRIRHEPYAVPTDAEVQVLLSDRTTPLRPLLLVCLLSGMRSGEAVGLEAGDLVTKGNLGRFFHVQPNERRLLKTEAAERQVPVHPALDEVLQSLPSSGPLFPDLSVNLVTKGFDRLRRRTGVERPGLVFHSTRKWFITQCERTGVPEHFTASIVGHQSARSENGITYSIYSAGISDEQKRGIVDQIRLPAGVSP